MSLFCCCVALSLAPASSAAQSAPDPSDAVYEDTDPEAYYYQAVQSLAAAGILDDTDCGPGRFCPDETLKRWQMAVWLIRALDETGGGRSTDFVDVAADDWWLPHVERLAALRITNGCAIDPPRYCPHQNVTRAQMASFLARAFDLPPAEPADFDDVHSDSVHYDDINRLRAVGITTGCRLEPLRYCPRTPVSRAQMAALLDRALDWVDDHAPPPEPEPAETAPAGFVPSTGGSVHNSPNPQPEPEPEPEPQPDPEPTPEPDPEPTTVTPTQVPGDTSSVTASALNRANWNHDGFPAPLPESQTINRACGKDCQIRIDAPRYLTPASSVTSIADSDVTTVADDDLVVVLDYGGEARAYSTDILTYARSGYIEIINDTIGTTPVTVAY